jgi:hypothetical protein
VSRPDGQKISGENAALRIRRRVVPLSSAARRPLSHRHGSCNRNTDVTHTLRRTTCFMRYVIGWLDRRGPRQVAEAAAASCADKTSNRLGPLLCRPRASRVRELLSRSNCGSGSEQRVSKGLASGRQPASRPTGLAGNTRTQTQNRYQRGLEEERRRRALVALF